MKKQLLFNLPLFKALAIKAYKEIGGYSAIGWPPEDVLSVFELYFTAYEQKMNRAHPPIKSEQIKRIIRAMPHVDPTTFNDRCCDSVPEDYEEIIDRHFKTEYMIGYGGCDYNINHFFSGNVRLMRHYEVLY